MKDKIDIKGSEIRFHFESPAYRKMGYIIPVQELEGRFLTGQPDLTYEQMIGKDTIPPEVRKKYPYIINPEQPQKVFHNIPLDITDPEVAAKVQLAILSERIAPCKSDFNSGIHDGYLVDKEADADREVSEFELKHKAYEVIRGYDSADLPILVLLVSLQSTNAEMEGAKTEKQMINALYKHADKNPHDIINCSEEHNPHIKDQLFIAYCVKHKLVSKRGGNFVIIENGKEVAFMGTTMVKAIAFLETNSVFKDRLHTQLKTVEPHYMVKVDNRITANTGQSIENLKASIGIAIYGNPALANSKPDLTKADALLNEYLERQGATSDYKLLRKAFYEKQFEFKVEELTQEAKKYNEKSIKGRTVNGYLRPFREEVLELATLEEQREFILNKYIEREKDILKEKLEETDNLE